MSSASRESMLFTGIILVASTVTSALLISAQSTAPATEPMKLHAPGILTVAADPNDLPFSNSKEEGFENKLAELVAGDLGLRVNYLWRASRRGFIRETLKSGEADVVMGVPTSLDMTLNSKPYYRAAYAFVSRNDMSPPIDSFDDPRLKSLKIGVPLTGDANPPPTYALAKHDLVNNIVGYTVWADYAQPNLTARILDALNVGEIDVAIAWAPLAGYFAAKDNRLTVAPITGDPVPGIPFAFNISMGVSRNNKALKARLDDIILRRHGDIDRMLDSYHIPRLPITAPPSSVPPAPEHQEKMQPCDCG